VGPRAVRCHGLFPSTQLGGTVKLRSLIALAICIVLGLSVGLAFGARSDQPDSTAAAKSTKLHREIKRNVMRTRADIKRLDRKVDRVENGVGTTGATSLADRLIKVERNTAKICREVGTFC
jgi:hypothetical protein